VLVVLNRQPGANIIETADRVKALLPQMRASIPDAISGQTLQSRLNEPGSGSQAIDLHSVISGDPSEDLQQVIRIVSAQFVQDPSHGRNVLSPMSMSERIKDPPPRDRVLR